MHGAIFSLWPIPGNISGLFNGMGRLAHMVHICLWFVGLVLVKWVVVDFPGGQEGMGFAFYGGCDDADPFNRVNTKLIFWFHWPTHDELEDGWHIRESDEKIAYFDYLWKAKFIRGNKASLGYWSAQNHKVL